MLTALERQSFRNHFWTAQLIGGGVMATHAFKDGSGIGEKLLFALGGFLIVIPFTALAAWLRVRWERTHPIEALKPSPSNRFWAISMTILAVCVALIFGFDYFAR